ncbi:MAG: alpha-L-rhamnosidase [Verrucomicrobiae bacterium]|nr:alpha-L-rhamnosidase [Verrucomicrobiae bacterium]
MKYTIVLLFLLPASLSFFAQERSSVMPVNLTCEYLTDPEGLDLHHPRFSWVLAATDEEAYGQKQTAYRIQVGSSPEALQRDGADMWDTGWVLSDQMQLIPYDGSSLQSDRSYYWRVKVRDEQGSESAYSTTARWSTGLFTPQEWSARWIGSAQQFDRSSSQEYCNVADPWLRNSFELKEKPARANLYVASVGYHELYVNGERIGDHLLAPAVTDHTRRARYIAYDIADALQAGENVIGLWLGASWSLFAPYITPDKPRTPIVIAQADIFDSRGERMLRVETDEGWRTHPSPNRLAGTWEMQNYGGEIWDANKDIEGWCSAAVDDSGWDHATPYKPELILSAQRVEPNRMTEGITPLTIEKRDHRSWRVDMGVNFAGWTRIRVKGNPGDTIHFLFSEREQDEITFNIRSAYVVDESGEGVFQNRFNYSSGRWITIKGMTSPPHISDIKGWVVRTHYNDATHFTCSDTLQNWIYHTVNRTFENLSLGGYIVDCPQRERFGYGGDAHATSETGLLNYKLGAFYTKWMEDWRDVQGTEPMVGNMNDPAWARVEEGSGRYMGGGVLPQSAPTYHGGGGPAWGGIVVTLPWFIYRYQGDQRILKENFSTIKGWLSFLDRHVEDEMLKRYGGPWDFLGDWLWPGATAQGMNNYSEETLFFNNCYRVYNLRTAARIARVIGESEDARRWEEQAARSSRAIHQKYYHAAEHSYSDGTMRSLAAALYGDIMPAPLRRKVMKRLEEVIMIDRNGHIDVGITGGSMLFKVLRDEGRDDLIYSMTSQTTYPSWGFMRENDATTIWEMWEKDLPGHSLLHSSYLYPGAWYIDGVAGIRRSVPGFRSFDIRVPRLTEEQISWAEASFDSPAGMIKTYWKREQGITRLNVTVPPNSVATIYFPNVEGRSVSEPSGYATEMGTHEDYLLFEVPAGSYHFTNATI